MIKTSRTHGRSTVPLSLALLVFNALGGVEPPSLGVRHEANPPRSEPAQVEQDVEDSSETAEPGRE